MDEAALKQQAEDFARKNRKRIAKELTDTNVYIPEKFPVSVFMAGSPGAGKTEYSKRLIGEFEKGLEKRMVRIDGDELRGRLPGYSGGNSHIFQMAVSRIVDCMHDMVLKNKQSFLLDGTFSNYERAKFNIERSLGNNRIVLITYLYQKPEIAWRFTLEREIHEGRKITKEDFIRHFFGSMSTIERLVKDYRDCSESVGIYLVKKNFQTNSVEAIARLNADLDLIDDYLKENYTVEDLQRML